MKNERLFVPAREVVQGKTLIEAQEVKFSSHEGALLLRAMVDGYTPSKRITASKLATNYSRDQKVNYQPPNTIELNQLVTCFREDPKQALSMMRVNLIELVKDQRIPVVERTRQLRVYLKKYIELLVKLDYSAFPPDGPNIVHEGVPSYIPDGLSDLGSDATVDAQLRNREKIRVDKAKSYAAALPDLINVFETLTNTTADASSAEIKMFLAQTTMAQVYNRMPYHHEKKSLPPLFSFGSIPMDRYTTAAQPVSVCRHIAMETQLRLQLLGLESRLLKCTMNGEAHVANVLRINNKWYLIDTTNPECNPKQPDTARPFMREISLKNIAGEQWIVDKYEKKGNKIEQKNVTYAARNNMYYRVLNNRSNPVR